MTERRSNDRNMSISVTESCSDRRFNVCYRMSSESVLTLTHVTQSSLIVHVGVHECINFEQPHVIYHFIMFVVTSRYIK